MASSHKQSSDHWEVYLASKARCEITVTVGMPRERAATIIREEKARARIDDSDLGSAVLSRLMTP